MSSLKIVQVPVKELKPSTYNPRTWNEETTKQLTESIQQFGLVDPLLVNGAAERKNIVIGGHFRLRVAKDLGFKEVPVVYLDIPDEAKEKELNLRLNKALGDWDYELLAEFDDSLLSDVGFSSEELDDIFDISVDEPETFDLKKELEKLDIKNITVNKGDIYDLDGSRLMCGDSTVTTDFERLMDGQQANMCMTGSPYMIRQVFEELQFGHFIRGIL